MQVSHDARELLVPEPFRLVIRAGSVARGMKSPTTKDLEELKRVGRYWRERPVGIIVFEPQTLLGVLKVFCGANHAGDLGNTQVSLWNGSCVVVTLDQAWERGAKHHRVEQWRIRIQRVAQIFSPCTRDQSNVE